MSSAKGKVLRLLSGVLLNRAEVVEVEDLPAFRRIVLRSAMAAFAAGTKLQLLLPSDDARTYSPIPCSGGFTLLGYKHAGGPGARWIGSASVGEAIHYVGPQRSLLLPSGRVLIVGDETSVAVAAAFAAERPGQVHAVIQTKHQVESRAAAASVGLTSIDVVAPGDTVSTVERVMEHLDAPSRAKVALTGGSELVVSVREALRKEGLSDLKAKAYWVPGRAGLD